MSYDPRLSQHFPTRDINRQESAALVTESKRIRGRRSTKEVDLVGERFVWRILTGSEKQECIAGAHERFAKLGLPDEMRLYADLEDEITWQILWRAMRSADHPGTDADAWPKPFMASVADTRDSFTVDEQAFLITHYLDFEEEVSPPVTANASYIVEIERAIKKNDTAINLLPKLINFGSLALANYIVSTVSQPAISPTGKSQTSRYDSATRSEGNNPTPREPTPSE